MKIKYIARTAIINVFTSENPQGQSFEVAIPNNHKTIAIDKNGDIHTFEDLSWVDNCSQSWDTVGDWEHIAELGFEVSEFETKRWALTDWDCGDNPNAGVFEVHEGE